MNWMETVSGKVRERRGERGAAQGPREDLRPEEKIDAGLAAALADFRSSVVAWSEAAGSRPRPAQGNERHRSARSWGLPRMAAGWALGSVLLAGGVSAGLWQHHREQVQMAVARAAAEQRIAAQQQAQQQARRDETGLLAQVDSDVSQEVPTAMEPLARLMVESDSQ